MDNECLHFSIFYKVHSAIERMIKMIKKMWPQTLINDLWGYETKNDEEINSFISSYEVLLTKLKNIESEKLKINYATVFDEYYRHCLNYSEIARMHNICRESARTYVRKSINKLKYFIRSNAGLEYTLSIFPNEPLSIKRVKNKYIRHNEFNHNCINLFLRNGISKEKICDLTPNMIINIPRLGKAVCAATLKYLGIEYLKKYWPECDKPIDEMTDNEIYSMFVKWPKKEDKSNSNEENSWDAIVSRVLKIARDQ